MPSRSGPPTVSGRWSALPPPVRDPTRRLHAQALALLERHGILIRGAAAAERVTGGFGALYPVLRALEDGGQCRRGYFVEGLGAAQFALARRGRPDASDGRLGPRRGGLVGCGGPGRPLGYQRTRCPVPARPLERRPAQRARPARAASRGAGGR